MTHANAMAYWTPACSSEWEQTGSRRRTIWNGRNALRWLPRVGYSTLLKWVETGEYHSNQAGIFTIVTFLRQYARHGVR